ncbi:MAG: ubiquinone biosynthesis hydroxylase, UbiH/UbiF/VisC/COQ6 [Proteobacteria bacterium]|nr:ubiquinone biosynthesis hydroxylase, UbiH/UbiF/VisC/COQ6 [Pseudomonadota bacterium]
MTSFYDAAISFPTVIYTTLLGVVMVYWLLALVGIVDFESTNLDMDSDLHADAHVDEISDLASYLVALGLNGVPFSVVFTLLTVFAWTTTCLAAMWLLPLVPTTLLRTVAGLGVLVGGLGLALPLTARMIRPMRGLFVTHTAMSNAALVGQSCRVLTSSVDEKFGRAEVATRGAGVNIKVWAETPNSLSKGSTARILEHDAAGERYLIVAEEHIQ